MHPADFFQSFWRHDKLPEVFVMMPFGEEHLEFWRRVVQPSIESVSPQLTASRTDVALTSGSVMNEVLDRIARSTLLLADISTVAEHGERLFRNDNVMYELGIAHAIRHSLETVIIRRDQAPLNFDLANTLVHYVDPHDHDEARIQLTAILRRAMASVTYEKSLMLQRTLDRLDAIARRVLLAARDGRFVMHIHPWVNVDPGDLMEVLKIQYSWLFHELGIVVPPTGPPEFHQSWYHLTPFGEAVVIALRNETACAS